MYCHLSRYRSRVHVAWQVEGTEYRVHGSLFEAHSRLWAEKLLYGEGENRVAFDNIKGGELDAFLSVLYPAYVLNHVQ